jgi:hypothetical protein
MAVIGGRGSVERAVGAAQDCDVTDRSTDPDLVGT